MRKLMLVLSTSLLLALPAPAISQVSFALNISSGTIGFNISTYPQLVPIPGYPVYYAPRLPVNYFFYDGMYWVFVDDNWYASAWYDGPWELVRPAVVPLFILRIPVRYYVRPPPFFRFWVASAPPHWGEQWGRNWEEHRHGWDHWNHADVPAPAPLPIYQRHYAGNGYPGIEQQHVLQQRNYRYRPRDEIAQHYYARRESTTRAPEPASGLVAAPAQAQHAQEQARLREAQQQARQREAQQARREQAQAQQPRAAQVQHAQEQARQREAQQAQHAQPPHQFAEHHEKGRQEGNRERG